MAVERVAVYIDGGNTYRKLKSLALPEDDMRFDFGAFVASLIGERQLVSKRYYVGQVRDHDHTAKSQKLVQKQQQFLDGLRNVGFEVKLGNIMYDKDRIREKGVDVKMAVDLVVGAADNLYDTAIIVSSDTDLIPAIKYVRNGKHKQVEYVGFTGTPSFGMIRECSKQRLFAKEDLTQHQTSK